MGGAPSRNQRDQNLHQNVKSSNQNFYPSNQKSMKVDHPKEIRHDFKGVYVEGKTSQIDEDISKDDFNYNDFKHDTNKDIFLVRTYGQEDDYIPPLYDESDRPREFISFADNKKNMPDLGNKNTDFDYLSVRTQSTAYQGTGQTNQQPMSRQDPEYMPLKETIKRDDIKISPQEKKIESEPTILKARDLGPSSSTTNKNSNVNNNLNTNTQEPKADIPKKDNDGASSTYYSIGTEKTNYNYNSQLSKNQISGTQQDQGLLKEDIKQKDLSNINPYTKQFQDQQESLKAKDIDPISKKSNQTPFSNYPDEEKKGFIKPDIKPDLKPDSKQDNINTNTKYNSFYSVGSHFSQYNDNSTVNQKGLAPIEIDHRLKEDILKDSQQIQPQIKKFDSGNPEILRAKDIDPFGSKSKNYGGIDPSPLLAQQKAGSATMNQQQIDSVKTKPSESLPTKQEPPIKQEPQNVQKPTNNNISPMLSKKITNDDLEGSLSEASRETIYQDGGRVDGIFGRTFQENFKIKEEVLAKDYKITGPQTIKTNYILENSITSAHTIQTSDHGGEKIPNIMENTQYMDLIVKDDLSKKKTMIDPGIVKINTNKNYPPTQVEKGPYFNVSRQKGMNKNQKTGDDIDGPLIKYMNINKSDIIQNTDNSEPKTIDRDSSLQPTLNWEPVVLGKREKLNFHPEFDSFHQPLGNSLTDDIFLPKYRLEQAKQDFIAEMDNLDKDPSYKRIHVAFVKNGPDGLGRRVYPFHVKMSDGTIYDLKRAIMNDFGYQIEQQRIYHKYLEVDDRTYISELKFENGELLLFGPVGLPLEKNTMNFRNRINERTIEEIAETNCSNLSKEEFEAFTSDENLIWPPYRNWTKEWAILHSKCRELKVEVEALESLESHKVSELMQFEKEIYELIKAFGFAANRVVHNIYNWKSDPIYIDNLHGKGGKKYIAGGMVVRECRDWILLTNEISEGENAYKIACNENRAFDFIRGKIEGVETPLTCIVVQNGVGYFVQSLCPITERTLVYGSNTEGIELIAEEEGKIVADTLAYHFNLKDHIVYDRVEKKGKYFSLPFDSEIHFADDGLIYFLNPVRTFVPDIDDMEEGASIQSKFFRPEFQCYYSTGEVDTDYMLVTWQNPTPCSECGELITDYDYFYYQKKMLDKNRTPIKEYFCCIKCYMRLKPQEGFKVPGNQIVQKTLPPQERKTKWINVKTNEIVEKVPMKLLPFNSDAYVLFPEFNREEDKKYIVRENKEDRTGILIASQKLKEDVIQRFIMELNNLEVIPSCSWDLTYNFHKRGINMRYLGLIALDVKHNFMRELMIREILARSIKVLIRDAQSFLRDQTIEDTNLDAQKLIIKYLNEIFTIENRQSSREIWELLSELVKKKFRISLEKNVLFKIQPVPLLHMIATKLSIKLNKKKIYDFKLAYPFSIQDITEYSNYIKFKNDYSYCLEIALKRARDLDAMGKRSKWFLPGGPERAIATEIFRQAAVISEFIFGDENITTAKIYKEFATHLEERHAEKGRPEYSRWNRCAGVADDALSVDARLYYKKALKSYEANTGYEVEVANCWIGLARLHKDINSKSSLALNENETTFKNLQNAIQIYEIFVGVDHPDTAHIYFYLAFAYKERARIDDSYPWMKKAFCLYFRIFGPEDEATILAFDATKAMGMYVDPNIESVSIEDLCQYLEDQEFQE